MPFLLHNTRAECVPLILGVVWSEVGIAFADDGFGNYVSVDLALVLVSALPGATEA